MNAQDALFWKFQTGSAVHSSPLVQGNSLYCGSGDSALHAISIIDGKKLWSFKTNGIIHATPLVKNGLVYIGSYDGTFYALQAKTGNLIWKFKTEGEVYFPKGEIQKEAAFFDTTIIFVSRDYYIYALDANTGCEKWRLKEKGSWVIATPLVYKDNIYVGTSDSHSFYSINKNTGVVNWKIALPMRVYGNAVQKNGIIYFGCFDGILRGVDAVTGSLKWSYQTKTSKENYSSVFNDQGKFKVGFELYGADMIESENKILKLGSILSTPAIENEIIYFGSTDGGIYAVKMNTTL